MMEEEDIPASIWGEAVIRTNEDGEYHRMDHLWVYLEILRIGQVALLNSPNYSRWPRLC